MNKTEKKLEVAINALKFYSKGLDYEGPYDEFGCGCCIGRGVAGKTARDALSEIERIEKEK